MNIRTDSFVGKKTWGVEEKEKVMVQCSLLLNHYLNGEDE